jgi:hypothetical protein
MPLDMMICVEAEIKALLHASRDCLRNRNVDTRETRFHCTDGYYCEAFGIMRGLAILGYGYFGPVNLDAVEDRSGDQPEQNFRWWFCMIEDSVLSEEGYYSDGHCPYCFGNYGKDDRSIFGSLKSEQRKAYTNDQKTKRIKDNYRRKSKHFTNLY